MNPDLDKLHAYPFERLTKLLNNIDKNQELPSISFSIGEPKHAAPTLVLEALQHALNTSNCYPTTKGSLELRNAIANWCSQRYQITTKAIDPEQHVLPVNGTREALFAIAQAVIDKNNLPLVLMPNPFYQIYEGAALLAGAQPWYINTDKKTHFLPDFDAIPQHIWQRCQLIYICNPGNPMGNSLALKTLQELIQKAEQYNFVIASDECYSELYLQDSKPPVGLLQAAYKMGNIDYQHCIVFHSLSKRSNLAGLRSGFVAGDADIIQRFYRYRTYHGCAMPIATQIASTIAWQDEQHVIENRQLYQEKYDSIYPLMNEVLTVEKPDAGFYLWVQTPIDDTEFTQKLFAKTNIVVLPGSYLSRPFQGTNPGSYYIRLALVAPFAQCLDGTHRIQDFCQTL